MFKHHKLAAALAIGASGGLIFKYFDLPLPWMLGSMSACAVAAMSGLPIAATRRLRPFMSATIGAMLGTTFTAGLLAEVSSWWLTLSMLVIYLGTSGLVCYAYFRSIARMDPKTAFFSAMPGGITDVVLMSSEWGADERIVALIHASRIFLVVLAFPLLLSIATGMETVPRSTAAYRAWDVMSFTDVTWFIASAIVGVGLGMLLKLPAKYLLGPMLVSASLHMADVTQFVLPSGAIAAAQVVLGSTIGCRFSNSPPRKVLYTMLLASGSSLMLMAISFGFAKALATLTGIPTEAMVLAYAPAGLSEMSLIALALQLEVPFVVVHQVLRIFIAIGAATLVIRWLPDK